jgi:ankyrin repeat protein
MELEFTPALFEKPQEENNSGEGQSAGLLLYSNEKYGSVRAFMTTHNADFAKFKKEFEDEIERVKKFAEDHTRAEGDSGSPGLSPETIKTIFNNFKVFERRLFGADKSGGNLAYGNNADAVFTTGKIKFFTFSKLLHNSDISLQARLDALANVADKVTVCGPGLINDLEDQITGLIGSLGFKELASNLTQQIAKQEIVQFANVRHPDSSREMETHVVQYYFNRLAQPAEWLPKPFAWPEAPDRYATTGMTGVSETDLKDCYAILKEKIQPSLIVRRFAEDYLTAVKDDVRQDVTETPFWEKVSRAQAFLKNQYGDVSIYSVMDPADYELFSSSALIAVDMLKDLKKKNLLAGADPKVLDRKAPDGEDLPRDLMQWDELFWVRQWNEQPPEQNANISFDPDTRSDRAPLRIEDLSWFSTEDVEASLARSGEPDAARVLNKIMKEAAARADMSDMLAIPDAWLWRMSIDEMLRTTSPDEPKHRAGAEKWVAFFKRVTTAGINIEQQDNKDQTLLFAAAEGGMLNAFMALLSVGANLRLKDREGQTPLLLMLKNGADNLSEEQWAPLFNSEGVKGSVLEERDPQGHTLLLTAARQGLTTAVAALIEAGADLGAKSHDGQNALVLGVVHRHDNMVMETIKRLRRSGLGVEDMMTLLNMLNFSRGGSVRDAAILKNCPKTLATINEFLVEAMEKKLLSSRRFKRLASDDISVRNVAFKEGYLNVIEAENALLIQAMERNWLTKYDLYWIVTAMDDYMAAPARHQAFKEGHAELIKSDNRFLFHVMEKKWLGSEVFIHLVVAKNRYGAPARFTAVDTNNQAVVEADNELLIEAMKQGWLSDTAFAEIVAARTAQGVPARDIALSKGHAAAIEADNKLLIEAMNNDWLTKDNFKTIIIESLPGYNRALARGHAEAIEEHNKLLRNAMKKGWLSNDEFREIVLNEALDRRCGSASGHASSLGADYGFLFEAMRNEWLTREEVAKVLVNSSAARQDAIAYGHAKAIQELNKCFVEALTNEWLTEEELEKAFTTSSQRGFLKRDASLENDQAAAFKANNMLLVEAMNNKWLTSESLTKIFAAALPLARTALANDQVDVLREYGEFLATAVKNGWLSEKAAGEIVIGASNADYGSLIEEMDNEWRHRAFVNETVNAEGKRENKLNNILGRQAALANGKAAAIKAHNGILFIAMENEWLTPEELKDVLIRNSAGREAALVKGSAEAIKADNAFLLLAREKNWLNDEDLNKLFAAGKAKTFIGVWPFRAPLSREQNEALHAHAEAILECHKNGWFSDQDLPDLEPERGWLQKTFPAMPRPVVDSAGAQNDKMLPQNDASSSKDLRDEKQSNAPLERQTEGTTLVEDDHRAPAEADGLHDEDQPAVTSLAQPEPSSSSEQLTATHAHPKLLAQHPIARQGSFAEAMETLGLELTIYDSTGKRVRDALGAFNDCSLHTLFRVDRELQSAYLGKDVDPKGWEGSLANLAEQLELSAGTDQITFGGITGEHLIRLFGMRGIECQGAEELAAGVALREFVDVVRESHQEGKTIVLLTDHATNVGGHYVSGNHFVTLVPPHKPHEAPDAPRPEDPLQQIWRISDSIPDDEGAPQYAEVSTRDIVQALEGEDLYYICVHDGPTHHEQAEQARSLDRKSREKPLQVAADESTAAEDQQLTRAISASIEDERLRQLLSSEQQASDSALEVGGESSTSISAMTEPNRLFDACLIQFRERIIAELAVWRPDLSSRIFAATAEIILMSAETVPAPVPDNISECGRLVANVLNSLAMGDYDDALAQANIPRLTSMENRPIFQTLPDYLAAHEAWRTHMMQTYSDSFEREQKQSERKLNAAKRAYEKDLAEGELRDKNKAEWEQAAEAAKEENVQRRVTANLTAAFVKTRSVLDQTGEKNYDLLLNLTDRRMPRSETFFLEVMSTPINKDGVYCLKVGGIDNGGKKMFMGLPGDQLKDHFVQKPDSIGPGDRFEARITKDVCSLTAPGRNKGKSLMR